MAILKLEISALNKLADASDENKLITEYLKRIPWKIKINQLDAKDKFPSEKQRLYEGELLLKSVPTGNLIIALDEQGRQFSSHEFAAKLEKLAQPVSFLIGGAYGLSDEVRNKAHLMLSLSKMTMPHALARVVLVEQIYRAYTIAQNHPYHK